jgi:hypothetical protein
MGSDGDCRSMQIPHGQVIWLMDVHLRLADCKERIVSRYRDIGPDEGSDRMSF